ncbi:hypothetical protein Peur_040697 [Populus x canadensis]
MRVKSENKFKPQFERNSYSLESESENSQPEIRVKPNKLKTDIPFVLYSHNPLDHTSIVQPAGVLSSWRSASPHINSEAKNP